MGKCYTLQKFRWIDISDPLTTVTAYKKGHLIIFYFRMNMGRIPLSVICSRKSDVLIVRYTLTHEKWKYSHKTAS